MSAPRSPSTPRERCFCGKPQAPELEYYCSPKCAREDALNALTLGAPYISDRPPTPPLPTLPPDFFKPPVVRSSYRSMVSNGSDEGFPYQMDLGPFASLHPRSDPNAIVPRGQVSKSKSAPASCSSSTRSSACDKPEWKSHYRRLREKESLNSISDVIQQGLQAASTSAATDDSIGSSSAASSSKGNLTQKMVNNPLRTSFGRPAPTAADFDFFDSVPLQNPRKPMHGQSIKSSTKVRSTSRRTSRQTSRQTPRQVSTGDASTTSTTACDSKTQSSASRNRALGSAFGRSRRSLDAHLTANETAATLRQDLRVPQDTCPSIESSTVECNGTAPLGRPLPPTFLPKQPSKGGAARPFLPLRRIDPQCSPSSRNLPQRLPGTTDVGSLPSVPKPPTATRSSTRLGVVVRQSVLPTKGRLPIGGGSTKLSIDSKPIHSRAGGVPLFLQRPAREIEVPKPSPSSVIGVEHASDANANSERCFASKSCTMAPALPKTPSPNTLSPGACSISVTPRLVLAPSLLLDSSEKTATIAHEDGREMDNVSSPSTSECPVTPADSAFTLGDPQPHPSAPVEWGMSKRSMEKADAAMFDLHRRFESGMVLGEEATPVREKGFGLAPH